MYVSMAAKVFEELYEYVPDVAVCGSLTVLRMFWESYIYSRFFRQEEIHDFWINGLGQSLSN